LEYALIASRAASPLWNSLALDREAPLPLQEQIAAYFRAAVLHGRLRAGTRVPSSRALAADHGVARITAVQAYDRLVAEGYLVARAGAGLFVADSVPDHLARPEAPVVRRVRPPAAPQLKQAKPPSMPPRPLEVLPLSVGVPALDHFPWTDLARITARVHRERPVEALGYCNPQGEQVLRQAIADYLGASRGVACTAEQILVVAGSQQGIDLCARVLASPGEAAWTEEPGYPAGRAALQAAGLDLVPVPVDGEGIDVAAGVRLKPRARLVLISPSHQYPLGVPLSLGRRLALLDWAVGADAWIIEDDYDGEYRYSGRPLAPLHTLDHGNRVLYLGTFSKVLAPALRIGYLVVPLAVMDRFVALKAASDRHAPALTQRVLARFMTEGRLAAHLRRMRTLYAARRAALLQAIHTEAADLLAAEGATEAGLHLVTGLLGAKDDVAISRRAQAARVHASPLSTYYAGPRYRRGFVLGFAGTAEAEMAPAVRRLAAAIRQTQP
jgi:GntR family transcriptional regulator/MocR family aminotransferase